MSNDNKRGFAKFKPQYPGGEYPAGYDPSADYLQKVALENQQELSMEEQADFSRYGVDQGQRLENLGLAKANAHKLMVLKLTDLCR